MEADRIIGIINKYLLGLGYNENNVKTLMDSSKNLSIYAMKLANANVVGKNKEDKSSHQTHIAVTGDAISFFCPESVFLDIKNDEIRTMTISLLPANVSELSGRYGVDQKELSFVDCNVSYGKRTQNQLQLSKSRTEDSDLFSKLRDGLHVNDLLVFWKESDSKKIYALGIREELYSEYDSDYSRAINTNVLIEANYHEPETVQHFESNSMTLHIYAEKDTDNGTCYLCGCSLYEYINNLSPEYMDNDIQRGIVKNAYLDRLINTIIHNDNIPTITLLGESLDMTNEGTVLELKNPRILDGLQRTFRIQEIWSCIEFFNSLENKDEIAQMNKLKLSRLLAEKNEKYNINVLLEIIDEYKLNGNLHRLTKGFEKNEQWFEVWEELSLEQETEKMLILNAGHRQMDYRHQLELLFLN